MHAIAIAASLETEQAEHMPMPRMTTTTFTLVLIYATVALACWSHLVGEVPKHVLLDLAGGGLGQLGAEDNRSGHHVLRQALPAPRHDVGSGHRPRRVLLEADERARRLTP